MEHIDGEVFCVQCSDRNETRMDQLSLASEVNIGMRVPKPNEEIVEKMLNEIKRVSTMLFGLTYSIKESVK